jgi:Amt family ammonium transporter
MEDQGPPSQPSPPPQTVSYADIVLIDAFLVFFMQVGFISLELGFGRSKNVKNVLLKNIVSPLLSKASQAVTCDLCVQVDILLCALSWWLVGYGIENGFSNSFIGTSGFLGNNENKGWLFTFGFALATVSIISGCLAERTNLIAYPILTIVTTVWIHPVVGHWAWDSNSWLQKVSDCEFLDFAGGTVVHVTGGAIGLVGAVLCGPRLGRFEEGKAVPMPGHDISQAS